MSGKYINAAQQRALGTLLLLAEHDVEGLTPGEISRGMATLPSNTTRDLANLRQAGLAEALANGRWRITPRLAQLAVAIHAGVDRARRHVEDTAQRFTAEPPRCGPWNE